MKIVLVPIGGSNTDIPVLETALAAAQPFAAHLHFLHVRVGLGDAVQHTPHLEFASGAALREAFQELKAEIETRSTVSIQHVYEFCARRQIELRDTPGRAEAVTATCREVEGNALNRVLSHARHSDLIVVGRRSKPNGLPTDFIDRLLLDCGRPVLIASSSAPQSLTNTIMVCWRESADAARAVVAASPFLAHARRVIFTAVADNSEHTCAAMSDMAGQFAWRGVPVETQIIAPDERPVQELLAAAARNSGADLIVSGAYGHSHISEIMFGGCTQSFIQHADRPILLMH